MLMINVGSKEWCAMWADFHWAQACKFSDRIDRVPAYDYCDQAMYHLFMHEYWATHEPWAKSL